MDFGKRLISIRKEKKVSQTELAKRLEIHANVLGRYERGESRPFIEMALKIAKALDVSTDYLLGNTDLELNSDLKTKLEEIATLPESNRKQLFEVIDLYILGVQSKKSSNQ